MENQTESSKTDSSPALAVDACSLARRVSVEIKAPGFYAHWKMNPDKLNAFLAFASECILAAHTEATTTEPAKSENAKLCEEECAIDLSFMPTVRHEP